jgi:hypothetical protein
MPDENKPKRGGQGQSAVTFDKERRIASAVSIGMRIASAAFPDRGYRFWHFDANSGSGWNDKSAEEGGIGERVPGSPLVFWKVAKACLAGMEPYPWFCDIEPSAIRQLQTNLAKEPDVYGESILQCGDNEEELTRFAETIRRSSENPRHAVGSVLVDPNGYFYRSSKGSGAPVNVLPGFCQEFRKIDVILNMNIRAYRLQSAPQNKEFMKGLMTPTEVLASLDKKHWLVAWAGRDNARFLLAVGRNFPTGDHAKIGLHDAKSDTGRYILNMATGGRQGVIHNLSGISRPPGISGNSGSSHEADKRKMQMRSDGNTGSSRPLSDVGDVRRAGESPTDLSQLPLFRTWEV